MLRTLRFEVDIDQLKTQSAADLKCPTFILISDFTYEIVLVCNRHFLRSGSCAYRIERNDYSIPQKEKNV